MSNATKTSTNQAAKGGKETKSNQITVIGYIVRNGVKTKRTDLTVQEQERLATTWSIKAMNEAGYLPADRKFESESGVKQ